MIAPCDLRLACLREHQEIIRCYAEWDKNNQCSDALRESLNHHHIVLRVLQDVLTHYDQPPLHSAM